ncbi:hypothetical protein ACEWPM_004960 [Roseovarius sp. S4756]|uniref:hypothetical protein n=1 Tax=Roseovarius maritimus TaxID=3342637 RepID=UPI0037297276
MSAPKRGTMIVAALASAALLVVSGVAVWRHLGGSSGDTLAQRSAVIAPVSAALAASGQHSDQCVTGFRALTEANSDDAFFALDRIENCGETSRLLADHGYGALDNNAGTPASPLRAAYLDAAGSLFSVYELQGDDFDVIFDMLHRARSTDAPLTDLASDVRHILGNGAPDIDAARQEATRAEADYRKRG